MRVIHVVPISGGKDSQATAIWAIQNIRLKWGSNAIIVFVFCDVKWEGKETYRHIEYIAKVNKIEILTLRSKKYKGFADMVKKKKRFPSTKARFCTEELKVKPMVDWILKQESHMVIYQGMRAGESDDRALLSKECMYFKNYFVPYTVDKHGKPKTFSYRKKEVVEYLKKFNVDAYRPILEWSTQDVFNYIADNGQKANPLYAKGFTRVGCLPCVMCRKKEIALVSKTHPERIERIERIEKSSFFPPNYIPSRCSSKTALVTKSAKDQIETEDTLFPGYENKGTTITKRVMVPLIRDVVKYVTAKDNQIELEVDSEYESCTSMFVCE